MPVTFQLNGQPLVQPGNPGLGKPVLQYQNQQADTLTVTQHGATVAFDGAPLFTFNQLGVLTRDPGDGTPPVPVFVGTIQEIPRRLALEETIAYVFHGPWQWLSTYAYLQTYNLAQNPLDVTPPLIATYMGRVVMAQAPAGTSMNLDAALIDIINFAIGGGCPILLGAITGLNFAVPWDEATDLTCDQAISRLLQSWAPDAVVHWDYTTTTAGVPTPTLNIDRRVTLPVLNLAVAPAGAAALDGPYAPLSQIDITPLYKDQCAGVVLFYPQVSHVGSDSWVTLSVDTYPVGAGFRAPRTIVRTINLAGISGSRLTQAVTTLPISIYLGTPAADPTIVTAASNSDAFAALSDFWKRKVPALNQADVVITGFKDRLQLAAPVSDGAGDGTPTVPALDLTLTNELITGAITPWMTNGTANRAGQKQIFQARIAYTVKGVAQTDAGAFGVIHSAPVTATNCTSTTYFQTKITDSGDIVPVGLAQIVFTAMSMLHYGGTLTMVEREASLGVRPGNALNLVAGLPEWATMLDIVQGASCDLDAATTQITVGPPVQLGADGLSALYRVNKGRDAVTSADTRVTGVD